MKIFLTKRAQRNYYKIKEFISDKWSENVANAFQQKTIHFLDLLENFPEMGTIENEAKQIRGFQMTKQTKVFYRIKGQKIIILTFFDVRQDPNKKLK